MCKHSNVLIDKVVCHAAFKCEEKFNSKLSRMHNRAPGRAQVDSRVMTRRGGLCIGFRVFMIVQAVQVNYPFFNFAVCSATKDHCAGMLSDEQARDTYRDKK